MDVIGHISFEDLKVINGKPCKTFHEACLSHGLLEDNIEWEMCLQDATEIQTGSQLCHLFTTILLLCMPTQPNVLWN